MDKKNIVFMPNISVGDGRNSPYQYSVKSWQKWCNKNNNEILIMEDLIHPVDQMKITWQRYYLFDILDANEIEYDHILMVDADTIIHPDCPNFFENLDDKYYGVVSDGCYEWVNRSIVKYHDYLFSDQNILKPWEYINGGFQIVNMKHMEFFKDVIAYYWNHIDKILYAQNTFKVGTDQTVINYLLRKYNINVEMLPSRYNFQDMFRKNLLHMPGYSWWPDELSNLYNSGWVYHFNSIPKNPHNRDAMYWMERVYKELYE